MPQPKPKIAVFHFSFFRIKGGAEKIILQIRNHYKADLFCVSYNKDWSKEKAKTDSFANLLWKDNLKFEYLTKESKIPIWRKIKRPLTLLFSSKIKELEKYDIVITDSVHITNKIKNPKTILYCHTPPRFLTDQNKSFLKQIPFLLKPIFWVVSKIGLKIYKKRASQINTIITNSKNTQKRLLDYTGLDSKVIFPAINTDKFKFLGQKDYYLSFARLENMKRIGLIVEAFKKMPHKKLILASTGSLKDWVEFQAELNDNIEYTGLVSDEKLEELVGNCTAGIYIPINEDAGMTQCEIMSAGKPVIGVKEGGMLETVIDGKTGILIKENPKVEDLVKAVNELTTTRALKMKQDCINQAKKFDKKVFFEKLDEIVE